MPKQDDSDSLNNKECAEVFGERGEREREMDVFGNQSEVNDGSNCYDWVMAKPRGPGNPLC